MRTVNAVGIWECHACGKGGEVTGVVSLPLNTPDGIIDAEFYPEKDSSGLYFAGCIFCGSEDVTFDDVRPADKE